MFHLAAILSALFSGASRQGLIEYATIAALLALVAMTGLNGLASPVTSEYNNIGSGL